MAGEEVDEDAPKSIAELSEHTSLAESFLDELEQSLLAKQQTVLVGPPGTSKTYIARQFARYFVRQRSGRPQGNHHVLYMHANWTYEDFFEGIKPTTSTSHLTMPETSDDIVCFELGSGQLPWVGSSALLDLDREAIQRLAQDTLIEVTEKGGDSYISGVDRVGLVQLPSGRRLVIRSKIESLCAARMAGLPRRVPTLGSLVGRRRRDGRGGFPYLHRSAVSLRNGEAHSAASSEGLHTNLLK